MKRSSEDEIPPRWLNRRSGGMPHWALLASAALVAIVVAVALVATRASPVTPASAVRVVPSSTPTATAQPLAIMFGDSYLNGWNLVTTDAAGALGPATATALGYRYLLGGAGATGYATARQDAGATPTGDYVDQLALTPLSNDPAAQLIVVEGGLSDLEQPAADFATAYTQVLELIKAQQPSAKVVVLGPPETATRVTSSGVIAAEKSLAAAEGVTFIPFSDLMTAAELRTYLDADPSDPLLQNNQVLVQRLSAALIAAGIPNY